MSTRKCILAFTGLLASGKGAACSYFIEKYGAQKLQFSTPLRDILDRLYLPHTRENMQKLSLFVREHFGQDILSKIIAGDVGKLNDRLIVIDGVRRPADVEHLRHIPGFHLIAIDVSRKVRYERLLRRRENPDDATKTWQEFVEQEQADAEVFIPEIMKQATFTVDNSGDIESLHQQLETVYQQITNEG